ncbi:hypothetical protein ACF3DV_23800 [Chlorogloeopsis fritschii PCC 9212]|uniref:Squalene cyclase C-terminal domain-containing protein n=1 Tax=Chlorogloeopsis fritschii PCC 6912 TaxID=211165 RepID=A0A3S0XXX5_CHLFR|nr:hypothetical protein [Chlorogloeopsis fritschii]RUR72233.1 hypothetical protein PCC6912_64500 [Chlorogloeopsis fritschii PCC 6912]
MGVKTFNPGHTLESSRGIVYIKQVNLLKCFAKSIFNDLFVTDQVVHSLQEHLEAAVNWLKLAHTVNPNHGMSWGYSLKGGWRASYREISGYIAVTFFDLARQLKDDDSYNRAVAISKWLCQVQNADGSISDPRYGTEGIVFDTGQVLLGLVRAFEESQDLHFLQAAQKARDWLIKVADSEHRWTRNTHFGIPHVYNTRVAWSLLRFNAFSPSLEGEKVALANLDWALSQQRNGWFEQCAFRREDIPFTHTIAYTIRGLLESGILLREQKYIDAAIKGAEAVIEHLRDDGFIPGQIDTEGRAHGNYCCLTGNCQMAIIWLKIFQITGEQQFYHAATKSLRYVMSYQDISTSDINIRGAIKGSHPIWGKYTRLSYPSWATKFFIDGLLMLSNLEP